jgi:DNA invertase Pin-like site-specific DNA recombinase
MTKKTKKSKGRPYKLTIVKHEDLIRRKASGETSVDLAIRFKIGVHTVYEYLKLDPGMRSDA